MFPPQVPLGGYLFVRGVMLALAHVTSQKIPSGRNRVGSPLRAPSLSP
jgi:hypothetical protein